MLSASHPYGMWVPAFPKKTFLGWPDCSHQPERAVTSTATLEVLGAAGCEPGEAFVARHPQPTPSIPGESSPGPTSRQRWRQDHPGQGQSQGQVNDCPGLREKAAGSLPPAPPGQTGSEEEEEEWRGRGEEVTPADRRGEGAARGKAGAVHPRESTG